MRSNRFIVKYLFLVVCLYSLSSYAQVTGNQQDAKLTLTIQSTNPVVRQNSQQVDAIISYAKNFLGTPYKWAGATPSGFDCSGFISYIFGNFGFSLVRTAGGIAEFGETVRLADIQPGDLMFFKGRDASSSRVGHVAMVVEVAPGAIKFIHASSSRGIVIDNFTTSKYYIPRFIKAKRLDYGEKQK
jgi:cell wall-associated NlpC family hydrolase